MPRSTKAIRPATINMPQKKKFPRYSDAQAFMQTLPRRKFNLNGPVTYCSYDPSDGYWMVEYLEKHCAA